MTESVLPRAELLVDRHVTSDEEKLVADALTGLGYALTVRELPPRRSVEPLAWLVLVALPLQAFLRALGEKAAEDAYSRLQEAVRHLRRRPAPAATSSGPPRPLVLQDPDNGLRIVLDHDLSQQAYEQLLTLDLTQYRLGPLQYDTAQARWRSELDEAHPR